MGNEIMMASCPNLLKAFLRRLTGVPLSVCTSDVDVHSRLTPHALTMSGWSHMFGNIMKGYLKRHPLWPSLLTKIRSCCKFFRNGTFREHLISKLKGSVVGVEKLLKHFSAKIAKWRYETAAVVFLALNKLRELIQGSLRDVVALFDNTVQDKKELAVVQTSFRDTYLWDFISVSYNSAFEKLESSRRWGLVCSCCSPLRNSGGPKQSKCGRSSRRLHEAREFMNSLSASLLQTAGGLVLERCGGDQELLRWTSFSLRGAIVDLAHKGHQYNKVPCLVAEADKPEIAKLCCEQLRAVPDERLTPLLLELRESCLEALEVSAGLNYKTVYA